MYCPSLLMLQQTLEHVVFLCQMIPAYLVIHSNLSTINWVLIEDKNDIQLKFIPHILLWSCSRFPLSGGHKLYLLLKGRTKPFWRSKLRSLSFTSYCIDFDLNRRIPWLFSVVWPVPHIMISAWHSSYLSVKYYRYGKLLLL